MRRGTVALAALAVVEFAPDDTFDPPRLGLPAPRLPLADLGSLDVPSLPPLDLTRVPLVGDALDRAGQPAAAAAVAAADHRAAASAAVWPTAHGC